MLFLLLALLLFFRSMWLIVAGLCKFAFSAVRLLVFFGSIRDVVKGKGSETNEPDPSSLPARYLVKQQTQT